MRFRRWNTTCPGSFATTSVEPCFERRDEAVEGRRIRPWPPFGRHLPVAQLADNFLQHFCIPVDVCDVQALERQTTGLQPVAVTRDAVLVEEGTLWERRLARHMFPPSDNQNTRYASDNEISEHQRLDLTRKRRLRISL